MSEILKLFFLFFIGCTAGWIMEVLFRRFNKQNVDRKWINPGFLTGPYLPLYGFGLCILYLLAGLEKYNLIANPIWNKVVLFIAMAFCMTLIEYIAGVIFIVGMKVKLWDYSKEKFNYKGIICLRFSIIWAILGALYYFCIHPYIINALDWFSKNLEFSFTSGTEFPESTSEYALVVHCGGCMLNEKEMKHRILRCNESGTPVTNYGIAIAQMHGILKRSVEPFPQILKILENT